MPRWGPTPGPARRTRATRTRQRLWPLPGTRRAPARLGRTSRRDSGTRSSSSPGTSVVWRAGGGGGVSFSSRDPTISPPYLRSGQTPWILSLPCLHLLIHFNFSQMRLFKERESSQLQRALSYTVQSETRSARRFFQDTGLGVLPKPRRLDYIVSYSWPPGCSRSGSPER